MRKEDQDHLKLLAIFHYILGAGTVLCSLLPVLYLGFGLLLLLSPEFAGEIDTDQARVGAVVLAVVGVAGFLIGLTIAASLILAGRFLGRCTHYIYCIVIAALECLSFPFGTVLGVFTLIVLSRESVKQAFGRGVSTPPMPRQPAA